MSEFGEDYVFKPTQPDTVELLEPDPGATNQLRVQVEGSVEALATFIRDASAAIYCERYEVTDDEQRQSVRMQRQDDLEMALEAGTLVKTLGDTGLTWGDLRVFGEKPKNTEGKFILKFQNNGGDKPIKSEWLPQYKNNTQ